MTVWCNVHHAPFKDGVTRWCKRSNPGDTCEVDKSSLPPRRLPGAALMMLGSQVDEPGWLAFLLEAKALGFGIDQPGDHDLSDEAWEDIALTRARVLVASFARNKASDNDTPPVLATASDPVVFGRHISGGDQ